MSFQRPIFNNGLFGKANASVCNGWTEATQTVNDNADGIAWAQRQVVHGMQRSTWLAKLTEATLFAPGRWRYKFVPFTINASTGAPVPLVESVPGVFEATFGKNGGTDPHELAYNLREITNDGVRSDGSTLGVNVTMGPVGSSYDLQQNPAAWRTTNLTGYVQMHVEYDAEGKTLYWFSEQNPVHCNSQLFNEFQGQGEGE